MFIPTKEMCDGIARQAEREAISDIREGILIFNGLRLGVHYGKDLMKNFSDNPDCIYSWDVRTDNAIARHKVRWEKVKSSIDFINSGKHSKYSHAELWLEQGGRISLYMQSNPCVPEQLDSVVFYRDDKVTKEPCMLDMCDDKKHVSYSIGDIRQYRIY